MRLTFRSAALLFAAAFLLLALVWLVAPTLLLNNWGVPMSEAVGLMGRRGGALFAGIGAMFFMLRHAAPGPARSALLRGVALACALLALLGVGELALGHAGSGILGAVVIEVAFVLVLLRIQRLA